MKRLLPRLMIFSGAVLVAVSFGIVRVVHPEALPLPYELAGIHLNYSYEGSAAVDALASLHGGRFLLTSAAAGYYGTNGKVTLWVAGAPFEWLAGRMVRDMQERIAAGGSPFHPVREFAHHIHTIHELEGQGLKHFYYQAGNIVVWLTADPEISEAALLQIVQIYH